MAYGLQTWDENGVPMVGPATMLGKLLGVIETGGADGSLSDARFAGQLPWAAALPFRVFTGNIQWAFLFGRPNVTFSGTTMSWAYNLPPNSLQANYTIYYGVR